ncbi:MAG: four-helix bundle copper-binding protein [Bacteroidetes bacterium]|nr:four-helix bundle copper-binding protein [Bacteroidota bacterium]
MPEYPLDAAELVYPGEGDVLVHDPPDPFAVAEHPLRVACMDACALGAEACRRVLEAVPDAGATARVHALCQACADICTVTHDLLARAWSEGTLPFAQAVCALCARTCRACAGACAAHPEVGVCGPGADAALACAEACEAVARA